MSCLPAGCAPGNAVGVSFCLGLARDFSGAAQPHQETEKTMERINQHSRAAVVFTLTWNSDQASHTEQFWADPVSFWRDVLDPQLVRDLLDKEAGDRASVKISAADFPAPYDERKRIRVRLLED